ncbi:MAG: peptide deformylase [Lentisphaerales bacterium]|jgi:peptide deformylase|nr:MAG: peptide deformylase [Lentisphaerales bacterium]
MKRAVTTYGDPVLRVKAEPVGAITGEIRGLAAEMLDVLRAANGLGLAAQQVGETCAMCIIEVKPEYDVSTRGGPRENPDVTMPMFMINPSIHEATGSVVREEGCLSFPEIFVPITRAEEITVTYRDLDGSNRNVRARGLLARAIQHEVDHLNGVLLVDRMPVVKRISLAGRLKRLRKETAARAKSG